MKRSVLVLMLVLFLVTPIAALCDVPFCDVAMETMRFSDWVTCAVFAMLMGDYYMDSAGGVHIVF